MMANDLEFRLRRFAFVPVGGPFESSGIVRHGCTSFVSVLKLDVGVDLFSFM